MLELDSIKNAAILGDFFHFGTWQPQKRSNSARLPQFFLHLTTWKNEAILRDFLIFLSWQHEKRGNSARSPSKMEKLSAELMASYPMRFAIFPVHLSKVLRLPRKSDARSYEVLHLSRKSISANLKIWCSKIQPLSGKSAPREPPNISEKHVSCTAPATENASLQILFKCPTPAIVFWKCYKTLTFCSLMTRCTIPCNLPRETTSERPIVVRTPQFFALLTSKCASRHNGVHFFDISTSKSCSEPVSFFTLLTSKCASRHNGVHFFDISISKSVPNVRCFVHFDLERCFVPQRRALFDILNF